MKKLLPAILLAIFLGVTARAQTAPTALVSAWVNTDAAWGPSCPSTSPKSCLGPLILTEVTSLTPVVLLSNIPSNATTATFTFSTPPSPGNHTYSIVATAFDANGNAVKSTPVTAVVDSENTLNAPTGFKVTLQ